ncbi:glycosyltransferase [Larkinella insperata]|uniref:Glycosyltransferase n=1 Tax=Larkinella insperata TaxID=332158 RepID=A0ABW3PZM5_9BACT|nr:nucleotide disphospho-sugar-binding domain-containing protein [Larkinella insperata]
MNTKKILFATIPADGHFNPLTGIAKHLQSLGHDVRWYTGGHYVTKAEKLGIPVYPFRTARLVNQENIEELFPERNQIKSAIARLRFDLNNVFLHRAPEFVVDITEIHREFPFDLLVCDALFSAAPLLKKLLNVPVATIGIVPLSETSKDLPPSGMGLTPARGFFGKRKQDFLRYLTTNVLLKPCTGLYNSLLQQHGLPPTQDFLFDAFIRSADVYLQSGVPGFEYARRDMSKNVRFVGPLLPYSKGIRYPFNHYEKLKHYRNVLLVTQGTVERDPEKIIVPTLEAFKDSDFLVIATTGGSQTDALRARYPHDNLIIEDFVDFNEIMPYCDVYVTNGGYGGVMLSIQNRLPMVAAGIHEGKSEITARIGYFKLGVNLKTETPTPDQIRTQVHTVLKDPVYRRSLSKLRDEFAGYNPNSLCEKYIGEVLGESLRPVTNPSVF